MFTYPCVSRLTVEVFIFSGSSDDELHGKRPGSLKSSRCVNVIPWFTVEWRQIDICNETA